MAALKRQKGVAEGGMARLIVAAAYHVDCQRKGTKSS